MFNLKLDIMKKTLTTLLAIAIIIGNIYAQSGTIKGIIKDQDGKPLWNVSVYVEVGGVPKGDAADFDGKYTIKPLTPGLYTVYAKMAGYKSVKMKNVAITSDKITFINMDMEQTAELLPEFSFVEYDYEKEKPLISIEEPMVVMLTATDLKNDPNIKDPIKMIGALPRVKTSSTGEVYISGSRPNSTQFITDGVKMPDGKIGIPGQAIGSIKVYTGGVPARYGDLTGGVIVVETKSYYDLLQAYK